MAERRRALGRIGRAGRSLAALLAACLLAGAAAGAAESAPSSADASEEIWHIAPTLKRLFRSHTSYQFGNPFERQINPLSRLEFPLDSWWGGLRLGAWGPRFGLELELLAALPGQDDLGAMRDSDWENAENPQVKTVYSESKTRLRDSLNLDAKAAVSLREALPLPAWLDLRPLVGLRWQRFNFVTHDGWQRQLESDPAAPAGESWSYMPLPGDGISFRQEYLHAYAGLLLTADLARLGLGRPGQGWRASLQGDLAQVWGQNRDHHLLRPGLRVTQERTQGYAWHTAMSLRAPLWSWGSLSLTGDYLFIRTTGDHNLSSTEPEIDLTFDYGVKVWSQQMGLSLALEIPF
ncbi:MAG: omptin family outer membrane protease [Thermodesulfobacteriota bacterium]